jgi:hypothetical protein
MVQSDFWMFCAFFVSTVLPGWLISFLLFLFFGHFRILCFLFLFFNFFKKHEYFIWSMSKILFLNKKSMNTMFFEQLFYHILFLNTKLRTIFWTNLFFEQKTWSFQIWGFSKLKILKKRKEKKQNLAKTLHGPAHERAGAQWSCACGG